MTENGGFKERHTNMAVQATPSADSSLNAFQFLDLNLQVELELGPGWILPAFVERASRYAEVFWLVVDHQGDVPDLSALPRTLTVYIADGHHDVQIPVRIHDVAVGESGDSPRREVLIAGLRVVPGICRVPSGARRLGRFSGVSPVAQQLAL